MVLKADNSLGPDNFHFRGDLKCIGYHFLELIVGKMLETIVKD